MTIVFPCLELRAEWEWSEMFLSINYQTLCLSYVVQILVFKAILMCFTFQYTYILKGTVFIKAYSL